MGKYFGTDGVRGRANETLTSFIAYRIGRFIGQYPKTNQKILLATDTRISKDFFTSAIASGVLSSGSDLHLLGVSTTPSVSYLVTHLKFDYGIMISASHNPYYDNGIKIFGPDGKKIDEKLESLIEAYIDRAEDDLPKAKTDKVGCAPYHSRYKSEYSAFLRSKAIQGIEKFKILVDCANGSAYQIAPTLLRSLGIDATCINVNPTGYNINENCGSTHIENLKEILKTENYDAAFAFDGDADRCLILTKSGRLVDGDGIIYLAALAMRDEGELNGETVVLTIMSNIGLKKALTSENIAYREVGVGDRNVQLELEKYKLSIGGEQSGHIIFYDDLDTGDGILTMIKILNIMASTNLTLDQLIERLKIYPQKLINVKTHNKQKIMNDKIIVDKINEVSNKLGDDGRLLVRPSGTEELIRVMVEAKTNEECKKYCQEIVDLIESRN